MTQTRNVPLPADLCEAAEKKFADCFASVDELLTFILRDLLRDDTSSADLAEKSLVEERLRELGYL